MIVYLSYPFPYKDVSQIRAAVTELGKYVGLLAKEQPHCIGVSALFESYVPETPPHFFFKIHAMCAGPLILAADKFIVIRAQGWEYSDIMREEVSFAAAMGKEIVYVDPIPQKTHG